MTAGTRDDGAVDRDVRQPAGATGAADGVGAADGRETVTLRFPRWSLAFVAAGVAATMGAGILAAATASRPSEFTVWATAYLVLVLGVVQAALGLAAGVLAARPVRAAVVASAFVLFNAGSALVITGTGLDGVVGWNVALVDVGGVALIPAMGLFLYLVRGARSGVWLHLYRVVVAVILISMPIGLILARV
ncbi:hypothetical protein [Tomitella cavernea]|uniref:hypothetical protein n=1 Tax=Tomitella cavernea TaxID=1387982 RepID=UPI001902FEA1|nr:hypothetical protein [Tomitella cavernea]